LGHLYIWTAGKSEIVIEALQPAFDRLTTIPPHQVVPFEDTPMMPETGDIVLVMGTKPLKCLQQAKLVHGGRTVTSLRQTLIAAPTGGYWLTTLDPFLVRTQDDAASLIRQDLALAVRVALTGNPAPPLGNYRQVEDFSELVVEVQRRLDADPDCYVELACDTETLGLHPEAAGARIVTIQFTLDAGTADVLFVPESGQLDEFNYAAVEWLLTHPRILLSGANWKYDSRWINRHWHILCDNISKDTLLMGSLVDENRSNSLKTHAWEYTALGGYDQLDSLGYDKGRMDLVPREVLTPYAGADTDVTIQSGAKIKSEMASQPKLVNLYRKILLPAAKAFEAMEHEGVLVDQEKYAQLRHDITDELDALEHQMLDLIPGRLKAKHKDKIEAQLEQGKSPLTPAILREYFFTPYGLNLKPLMVTPKSEEPSTAKAHLMMFQDHEQASAFVEILNKHTSASKTRSTFIDGFLKHLRPDGRFHPSYMLFAGSMFGEDDDDAGTVTGRTSCKEPAFQTIPKKTFWAKRLRECFIAPEGKLIGAFDFSQGELKVVACVANEANMIAAFKKGLDLHIVTAAAFMGISYDAFKALEQTDPFLYTLMRTGAKAGNFGLLYGMKEQGFQNYSRTVYNVKLTIDEATERRDAFFGLYPGLLDYHTDMERFVRKHGYVESPIGRRRHLPLIKSPDNKSVSDAIRQAINAPVQSTLNDLALYAASEIPRALPKVRGFGMVHDQLLYYFDEDRADVDALKAKEVMDNLPIKKELGWDHALAFTSDGELGPNLAKLEKIG